MSLRYLFLDMNSYFASVEQQMRPELRGKPVAVAPVEAETTSCIAASYEAKHFGVRTGTRVADARRLCPGIQIVAARPKLYITIHHQLLNAIESCLPIHAVRSIDEVVCPLRGNDKQPEAALQLAKEVKAAIRDQVGAYLRCSIGLASNQLLAKVAADMQKPDGLTMIRPEELPQKLYSLKLNDFPGIGPRMERRFHRVGITTVEQLCRLTTLELASIWGSRWIGQMWWQWLRGEDVPETPTRRRTLGHSYVLPPQYRNETDARAILFRLLEKAAARLRHINYWTHCISIWIQFFGYGHWEARQSLISCQDTLTMIRAAAKLWQTKPAGKPIKVGVTLSELTPDQNTTPSLFPEDYRLLSLSRAMDQINQKYGLHKVYFAGMHGVQGHARTRIAFNRIPDITLTDS